MTHALNLQGGRSAAQRRSGGPQRRERQTAASAGAAGYGRAQWEAPDPSLGAAAAFGRACSGGVRTAPALGRAEVGGAPAQRCWRGASRVRAPWWRVHKSTRTCSAPHRSDIGMAPEDVRGMCVTKWGPRPRVVGASMERRRVEGAGWPWSVGKRRGHNDWPLTGAGRESGGTRQCRRQRWNEARSCVGCSGGFYRPATAVGIVLQEWPNRAGCAPRPEASSPAPSVESGRTRSPGRSRR